MDLNVVSRTEFTDDLYAEIGRFVADHNRDPAQHIGYLGEEPDDVTAELHELEGGFAFALARDTGALIGVLGAEWDPEIARVWLLGPWAGTAELMDRLYRAVLTVVPDDIAKHEMFCNVANVAAAEFARRHGFSRTREQYILRFERSRLAGLPPVTLPALAPAYRDQFAALHDRAFPNTFAPAAALLAKDEPIWMAVDGTRLLGYVVLKLRPRVRRRAGRVHRRGRVGAGSGYRYAAADRRPADRVRRRPVHPHEPGHQQPRRPPPLREGRLRPAARHAQLRHPAVTATV
ncbi:MAG: hypothetical protein AUI14_10605 [Actinobacteria bacterium 13_2_20CM_2_71_6]|nr:MAG: hypothetical protein AUI14_10605 [Actinobacteria bacterium 13_2_20CM_2_71_6]